MMLPFSDVPASPLRGRSLIIASRRHDGLALGFAMLLGLAVATGVYAEPSGDLSAMQAKLKAAGDFEARVGMVTTLANSLMMGGRGEDARTLLDPMLKEKADARLIILKARSYLA